MSGVSGARGMHVPQEWDTLVRSRTGVFACPTAKSAGGGDGAQGDVLLHTAEGPKRKCCSTEEGNPAGPRKRKKPLEPGGQYGAGGTNSRAVNGNGGGGGGQCSVGVKSVQDVCNSILQGINRVQRVSTSDADCDQLNIDHVLSRVPYKQMLQDLFGGPAAEYSAMPVPVVSRVYEERYMREPRDSSERQCIMGADCEFNYIDKRNPFTGVEFLLPDEPKTDEVQMCVLCHRRFVQSLFYDVVYGGKQFRGVVQKYGNICGQPGEYAKEVALICPPNGPAHCMPFPAISHQRNRYSVVSTGGVRYVLQHNMSPEDFRPPPRGAR